MIEKRPVAGSSGRDGPDGSSVYGAGVQKTDAIDRLVTGSDESDRG